LWCSEQRPHVIYGSYEYRLGLPPLIVSPLPNLYLDKFAPLSGYCSRLMDITPQYEEVPVSPRDVGVATSGPGNKAESGGGVLTSPVRKGTGGVTPASNRNAGGNQPARRGSVIKLDVDYKRSAAKKPKVIPSVLERLYEELLALTKRVRVGYEGEINEEGERHGRGIYTYANGEKYIGEWEHGKKQGCGFFQHSNGDTYDGEFHQDNAQGLCTLRYATGDSYFGELHHGKRSGHGLLEFKNGDLYEGEFRRDVRCGEGVMKYATGEVYAGQFRHDARHGFGVLSNAAAKVVYHGAWRKDEQAPDFKPGDEVEEREGEQEPGEEGHRHRHHHKHHHKHKHHHHHSKHHGDAEEAPTEGAEDNEPGGNHEDGATLDQAADPRAAQAAKEKMAKAKALYAQQRAAKMKTVAEVERQHREDAQNGKHKSPKKKVLPAHGVEESMSAPVLPIAGTAPDKGHAAGTGAAGKGQPRKQSAPVGTGHNSGTHKKK
jgi:hypothetical protein